jgi:hypothetical protein
VTSLVLGHFHLKVTEGPCNRKLASDSSSEYVAALLLDS